MVKAGVVGFKCFLINSGVSEFPYVTPDDLEVAFSYLNGTGTVLAVNILNISTLFIFKLLLNYKATVCYNFSSMLKYKLVPRALNAMIHHVQVVIDVIV